MPFTVAHVAAVLPLRGRRLGLPLVTAPLVAGSMVPDLPSFFGLIRLRAFSHHWSGVITVDVLMAVGVGLLWVWLLADPLIDLLPTALRDRVTCARDARGRSGHGAFPALGTSRRVVVGSWALSAVVGASTHVAWDSCTHRDGTVVRWLPALTRPVLGLPVDSWLQYLSGVFGTLALLLLARRWARTTPMSPPRTAATRQAAVGQQTWRPVALAALGVIMLSGAALRTIPAVQSLQGIWLMQVLAAGAAFGAGAGAMLWSLLYACWWWGTRPRRPECRAGTHPSCSSAGHTTSVVS